MGKIIKYEFLKIFTSKLFLYTLIAFVLIDIILLVYTRNTVEKDEVPYSAYKILNKEIKDLLEIEKQELINKEYERNNAFSIISSILNDRNSNNAYIREFAESLKNENKELYDKYINEYQTRGYKYTGDEAKELAFFKEIKKEYEECKNYKQTISEILEKAENLETISIFQESQDDFSNKNIKDTAQHYKKMLDTSLEFIPAKGINNFTKMGITDILIVLLIFVISTIIIYEEREKNLFTLIKSTKNGRCKTILAKIFVMFILIFVISLILYAINFIYYAITIGYGNLSANLQSINTFIYSTLPISIRGYIVLFFITKITIFFIISLIILLVSNLAKNNVSNYIALILIFGISFLRI
ncbi:MAG: ABC transporter permease [Clostridia bacterium]|nr:ABC transporter permease [Clostridia bacterium]